MVSVLGYVAPIQVTHIDICSGRRSGLSGIAGLWTIEPNDVKELAMFTDMLENRGPAGRGFLTADSKRLGLGQRWLRPIGENTFSGYPLVSHDNRYAMVFNGEIYNRGELRHELEAIGHQFRSGSDAEIVLTAFAEWGPVCQNKFNGDWSVVIWDDVERTLLLSRDRFGNKPLHYAKTSNGLAFASERKAFFALPWVNSAAPEFSLENNPLQVVQSGTYVILRDPAGPLESHRWWHPMEYISRETAPYADQVEKFRELMLDACRLRLQGDLPTAASVSGGMDSSAIMAIASRLQSESAGSASNSSSSWKGVFTVTAKGTTHDELAYALSACKTAGVEPHIIDTMSQCDPNDIEEYLYLTEGLGLNHLSGWYLYRAMHEHGVEVSVDGHGADEMLIGEHLDVYKAIQLEGSWIRHPRRTLEMARISHALGVGNPYIHKNSSRQIMLKLGLLTVPPLRELYRKLPGRELDFPKIEPTGENAEEIWTMSKPLPPTLRWSFLELFNNNQHYRERFDMLGISNQIELRYPFLDWRLACYVLSLPSKSLLGHGYTKRILRDAMRPYLPEDVVTRKSKLRFEGAVPTLLQNQLRDWLLSLSHGDSAAWNETLDSGRYRNITRLGQAAVNRWREEHFSLLAAKHAGTLRSRFDADSQATLRAVRDLG